jgi:hypothetical protein
MLDNFDFVPLSQDTTSGLFPFQNCDFWIVFTSWIIFRLPNCGINIGDEIVLIHRNDFQRKEKFDYLWNRNDISRFLDFQTFIKSVISFNYKLFSFDLRTISSESKAEITVRTTQQRCPTNQKS